MKKIFSVLTIVCAVAALTTVSSCTKTCDPGYEGSDCKTAFNTKFTASYSVRDTAVINGTQSVFTYTMNIVASSSDPTAVSISNFGGFNPGSSTAGVISNSTTLTVPNTTIGNEQISNASGTLNGTTLSFTYTAMDSTGTSVDHAVGTH